MLTGFVQLLREYGLPVGMDGAMDLLRGLERGIGRDLDDLFIFARLCLIKRVEHMDAYERAFALYFYDVDIPNVAEGDPSVVNTPQFRAWLRRAIERGELKPVTENLSRSELIKRFWETLRSQMREHHGGRKWIGTGGVSPFGHSGAARGDGGVRVYGGSKNRSASKVIGDRRYVDYSSSQALSDLNIRQALDALKHLKPAGAPNELDIRETIRKTAQDGGEIELVFRRELRDKIRVVLLMDNGGSSMTPFVQLCRMLFSRVKDRFSDFVPYYFHNTVYETLYTDAQRRRRVPIEKLMQQPPETRVLFLGDASMSPDELLATYGSINFGDEEYEPSIRRLGRIRDRFRHSAWINPIPREYWEPPAGAYTLHKIREVFPMFDLTLGGIRKMVEELNRP